MASFFADENVPLPLVEALRALGHDVLTAYEAGRANQGIADPDVLQYAAGVGRAVLTANRKHFHRLHRLSAAHAGIVTFTEDPDATALALRVHGQVAGLSTLAGQLIRVVR